MRSSSGRRGCGLVLPHQAEEVPGRGVRGLVDDHQVAVGEAAWPGVTGMPGWAKAAPGIPRRPDAPTYAPSCTGCMPSSGCRLHRKTKTTSLRRHPQRRHQRAGSAGVPPHDVRLAPARPLLRDIPLLLPGASTTGLGPAAAAGLISFARGLVRQNASGPPGSDVRNPISFSFPAHHRGTRSYKGGS
jgi:hypothetical protein